MTTQAADLATAAVEAVNRGDASGYASRYAVDAVLRDPLYPDPVKGRDGIEREMASFLRAFPDAHGTVQSVITDGDRAAAEVTFTATHDGPLETPVGDIAPTGRRVTVTLCGRFEVGPDGLIRDNRRYYDVAALLTQLGLTG